MLGNKPPYTTMQQLNLDWILSKLKTLLRLVPDDGAAGQILRRTRDGAVWSDEQGGGGGGAVQSVNGKTGAVVLDADDVGALPDDYTPPVTSVNGQTGAVVVSVPVQSVNGKTGAVVLDADDVGALPDDYTPPANIDSALSITIPSTYTFPSDGYLLAAVGYQSNSYVRGRIQNQSGEDIFIVQLSQPTSGAVGAMSIPIFVRKNMKFRAQDQSNGTFFFYPFIN